MAQTLSDTRQADWDKFFAILKRSVSEPQTDDNRFNTAAAADAALIKLLQDEHLSPSAA